MSHTFDSQLILVYLLNRPLCKLFVLFLICEHFLIHFILISTFYYIVYHIEYGLDAVLGYDIV